MQNVRNTARKPVIVAVDGSAESANALRWASKQARKMGCGLRIITCYQHRYIAGETAAVSWEHFESTKRVSQERAQQTINEVLGHNEVEHIVALGPVDAVLIDHSRDASMIVLGTRSSYGIKGALRSSTTNRITGRVTCPVMSIPLEAPVLQEAS